MKIIDYYDAIHKQKIKLEVNDEVAKFLQADNKKLVRQAKRDKEYIAFSLNEITNIDGDNSLKYEEILPDENSYVDKTFKEKQLKECLWSVVEKLNNEETKAIKAIYKLGYKPSEVAHYFDMSTSAFSQFKDTALKHLHILLSYDAEFRKTDFYTNHYKSFADAVIDQAKEELSKNTLSINLDNVLDLMKSVTQINKITEKIGIKIPEQITNQLEYMTKPVWGFIKELKKNSRYDESKQNYLNIPIDKIVEILKHK